MAKIQLDPVTKLPIWPNGEPPPHPRDKQGNLIVAPPVYQPPIAPTPEPVAAQETQQVDQMRILSERLDSIERRLGILEREHVEQLPAD